MGKSRYISNNNINWIGFYVYPVYTPFFLILVTMHKKIFNNWENIISCRTVTRVLYGEVDSMRQAYYGSYMRWFEKGRSEYLRSQNMPYGHVEKLGFFLPVSEVFCKYLKPVLYDQLLYIDTGPDLVRFVSIRFQYRLLDKNERILAYGYTVHPCLDTNRNVVRIPDFLEKICERKKMSDGD